MKYTISMLRILPILFVIFISSCMTADKKGGPGKEYIVDAGTYSIIVPNAADWKINVDKASGLIDLSKSVIFWNGKVLGDVTIKIFQNNLTKQKFNLTEDQVADDYRDLEEQVMVEEGVKKGKYKLEQLNKTTTAMAGKKLYTMSYRTFTTTAGGNAILYLYFPPDFGAKHRFFGFFIQESHMLGVAKKGSLEDMPSTD